MDEKTVGEIKALATSYGVQIDRLRVLAAQDSDNGALLLGFAVSGLTGVKQALDGYVAKSTANQNAT